MRFFFLRFFSGIRLSTPAVKSRLILRANFQITVLFTNGFLLMKFLLLLLQLALSEGVQRWIATQTVLIFDVLILLLLLRDEVDRVAMFGERSGDLF